MKIPDLISTIVAYRTWAWDAEGIASLNCERWIPGEAMKAICSGGLLDYMPQHKSPHPKCSCGVYAAKNFKHLVQIGYAAHGIHGEVELWGTVMEHRLGYRAQFAYPKNFVVPEDMLPYPAAELESRLEGLMLYGVDIYFSSNRLDTKDNILLWSKTEGIQQTGLDRLVELRAKWYLYKIEQDTLKVGDRIFIKDKGIAIVVKEVDDKKIRMQLFNRMQIEAQRSDIKWSTHNNRWETAQMGFAVCGRYTS